MNNLCELCGEPMPVGEEMFKYHGYSCDCPKPPLEKVASESGGSVSCEAHRPDEIIKECINICDKIIEYTQKRMQEKNAGINPLTGEPYKLQEFCMETIMVGEIRDKLILSVR